MKVFRELKMDFRSLRHSLLICGVILTAFVGLTLPVQARFDMLGKPNVLTLKITELLIPFESGYLAVMLMVPLYGEDNSDLFLSYKKSGLYWGLIRQCRLLLLEAVVVFIVCTAISAIMGISTIDLFILTISQCLAVSGVSFWGTTVSKRIDIGLIVLIAFITLQLVIGQEFTVFNFLYCLDGYPRLLSEQSDILWKALCITLIAWPTGQRMLRTS